MANEEVSNIGVKLSLDASNFTAGLGTAQGKLNTFQQQAAKAASGAGASKAGANATPTMLKVEIAPAQLQAALTTAAKGLQTVHVPIDVDSRAIAAMRTKITQGLGVIPVQLAASFPKTGPGSAQAIIGTVFSSMAGVSPQRGQILAKSAIEQILPKRATGGPVGARQAVVVGEHRAEVFRPGASGFIEKDLQRYRQQAAQLAALEYEISRRQRNVQHALRGARVPMLPPGGSMPPALGSLPLREGYVRGFHGTKPSFDPSIQRNVRTAKQNLDAIRQQGLRLSSGIGHTYGEPDAMWFAGDKHGYGNYDEAYAVEAHLPARWFERGGKRSYDPFTIGGPSSNMAVYGNISRRRFATFNEPWMKHTRYMMDEIGRSGGTAHPTPQTPGGIMREFGPAIRHMRQMNEQRRSQTPDMLPYSAETQGYDQFVAEMWRARHRAGGGRVDALKALLTQKDNPVWSPLHYALSRYGPQRSMFAKMQMGEPSMAGERLDLLRGSGDASLADVQMSQARHLLERAANAENRDKRSGLNAYFKREWGTNSISSMLNKLPRVMRESGMSSRFLNRQMMGETKPFTGSEVFTQLGATNGPVGRIGKTWDLGGGNPHWAPMDPSTAGPLGMGSFSGPIKFDEGAHWYNIPGTDPDLEVAKEGGYNDLGYGFSHNARGGRAKALRPTVCPTCKLVNWQTMAGPARTSCFKCGSSLRMPGRAGGGPVDFQRRQMPPGVPESLQYSKSYMRLVAERDAREAALVPKTPRGPFASLAQRLFGRHMGGMVAHRGYGGEASSLYGGDPEALEAAAIEHFGVTDDIREAGYLTPSGKYLDFSGRHQASGYRRVGDRWVSKPASGARDPLYGHLAGKDYLAGQRSVDHNEANQILPGLSQSDAVERMKSLGMIRVWGTTASFGGGGSGGPLHTVGAEMTRLPTMAQISRLVGAAREAEHASLDVYDPMGYRLPNGSFSTEWPDDPIGGKKMGSFIRQAVERIQQNDAAAEELRESMSLGAGFNPNLHRAGGGLAFHEGEFRRFSDMAAANPLSRFGGNMWYRGRRRAMLEEANSRGWLDRSGFGSFRRSAERVLAVPGLASPGIGDEMAMHWSRSILDAIATSGPAGRGQEDAFVKALQKRTSGLGVGYGYGNFAKAAAVASGNIWPPPFGVSPKVGPFYHAVRGREQDLVADVHHLMAGGFDPNGPAGKVNKIVRAGQIVGTKPTAERALMLEASKNVQAEYAGVFPTMSRWQAGIWGEHFPFGGKPQPIQAAYTNLIVPKGMRGDLPPGASMGPNGEFIPPPRASGGPVELAALWAKDPYLAIMAYEAQMKDKTHRAGGGPALSRIRSLAAYRRYVAMRSNEPLFTRWSPDITKDMMPGAVSKHLEYPWHGDLEKGISSMPANEEAVRRLMKVASRTAWGEPITDDLEGWQHGLSGSYDLGPAANQRRYTYREDPLEGFRERNLYVMRAEPVGRGFDEEPVVDPESIRPLATVSRSVVEAAYREWRKAKGLARGGRAWKDWPGPHRTTPGGFMANQPEWYQARYSSRGSAGDYAGRPRMARDFVGPALGSVPTQMPGWYKGDQDWLDVMSGDYGWGSTGPYQRYVTDEQWRGPEAGSPRVALPGMQNEPELKAILQSMALARHQKPRMSATGGRAGGGLYIVNEQGDNSEGFVASQDEHLIPKFVMDRIPGARDGARTGMIRKPANSMFAPAQDGMIIPKWAVPYVPALHRAGGGPAVPPGLPPGYTVYQQAASAPGAPPIDYAIPPGITNSLQHILSGTAKTVEEAQAEHAKFVASLGSLGRASSSVEITRPSVAQDLAEGRAGIGKELPSRTARGAVASIASYLVGGVQEYDQAMVRRAQAEKSYTSAHRATSTLIKRSADELAGWRVAKEQDLVTDEDRTAIIAKNKPLIQAALATEKARGAELQKATKATLPTTGGILKNLGVIISATSAYGLAMQAANAVLQPAIEGTIKSTQSWVDQFTGFATTSQQVTKAIGDSARNLGGNVAAAVAQATGQGGLGNAGNALAQQYLTGGALAKGGGAAASQGEDLRKAIMGAIAGAPQGLFGGYGGFLGGGFLGETLGGGKGAVESLTGPLAAAAGAAQDARQGTVVAPSSRYGAPTRLAPTAEKLQQATEYTGLIASTVKDYNDASQRYTMSLGKADDGLTLVTNATPDQIKAMKDHADAERHLGGAYADYADRVADLAKSSTVLLDASGQVVTSMKQATDFWQNVAGGSMIPTLQEYATQQARGLQANFQQQALMAAHQIGTVIPGQLGLQLAAQPFAAASAGVLTPKGEGFKGTVGGINVASTLAQAQQAQNDLTTQGADALKSLSDWIGQQPGMQGPYSTLSGPGVQYSGPIGPGTNGQPLQATVLGQTFSSGKAAFDFFTGQMMDAGKAITMWQTKIAGAQTQEQWAQFSNNLRLANRSYADALALAGRGGGGTGSNGELGGLERQQTLLGFGLSQKQINFQTAVAGFQAPGLTSEERAAREAEAQAEAKIAQKQLNIQEREFTVSSGRGVTDTGAAVKLLKSEQATQTAVAAAQKAIAAEQLKLSQAQAKAQVIQQQAEGNFGSVLSSAAGYASQFGTAVDTAVKQIYSSLGYTQTRGGNWVQRANFTGTDSPIAGKATGFLGSYARGAVLQVGEAGPETVAILRNPRAMMMGGGFGGGSAPVTVHLNLTVQGDIGSDATVAKLVRAVEDSFNRKAARLGMRSFVSATG